MDSDFGIIWKYMTNSSVEEVNDKVSSFNMFKQCVICIEVFIKPDLEPLVFVDTIDKTVGINVRSFIKQGESSRIKRCAVCKKIFNNIKICSRCMSTNYCSRRCQIIDYPYHKHVCIEMSDLFSKRNSYISE